MSADIENIVLWSKVISALQLDGRITNQKLHSSVSPPTHPMIIILHHLGAKEFIKLLFVCCSELIPSIYH